MNNIDIFLTLVLITTSASVTCYRPECGVTACGEALLPQGDDDPESRVPVCCVPQCCVPVYCVPCHALSPALGDSNAGGRPGCPLLLCCLTESEGKAELEQTHSSVTYNHLYVETNSCLSGIKMSTYPWFFSKVW